MTRAFDYGAAPAANEFEVTIFGPGYGEAIAVHLGGSRWLLVDSCVEASTNVPASANYLDSIGASIESVQAIVASHWHDDHVRGMAQLVEKYPHAPLFIPAVFGDKQSTAFLSAYSGIACSGLSRGTKEMYQSLSTRENIVAVKTRSEVLDNRRAHPSSAVVAFSPTDAAFEQFLARIINYVPRKGAAAPIGNAPEIAPNLSSVVLHVDLGIDSLLLGADLECHATAGWDALVTDAWCLSKFSQRSGLVKIAHHGSVTGDHPGVWEKFLGPTPVALLSPFNSGRHALPNEGDRMRIQSKTKSAFITSTASMRARLPNEQLKRLQDIATNVQPVNSSFGAVRARRNMDSSEWRIELFGAAGPLQPIRRVA